MSCPDHREIPCFSLLAIMLNVFEAMKAALTEMQQSIPTNLVVVKY